MALSIEDIRDVFERYGELAYSGEPVSQLEHALQTAQRAEQDGAPDTLITAALLHDLGHLLHPRVQAFDTPTERASTICTSIMLCRFCARISRMQCWNRSACMSMPSAVCALSTVIISRNYRRTRCAVWRCKAGSSTRSKPPGFKPSLMPTRRCACGAGTIWPNRPVGRRRRWGIIWRWWGGLWRGESGQNEVGECL